MLLFFFTLFFPHSSHSYLSSARSHSFHSHKPTVLISSRLKAQSPINLPAAYSYRFQNVQGNQWWSGSTLAPKIKKKEGQVYKRKKKVVFLMYVRTIAIYACMHASFICIYFNHFSLSFIPFVYCHVLKALSLSVPLQFLVIG